MKCAAHASTPVEATRRVRRKRERRNIDFSTLHPDQNMTEEEVCCFLSISRSTLRNKLKEGGPYHDPSFPKPHPMRGQAQKGGAVRWIAGLIMNWNRDQQGISIGAALR